MMLSLPSNEVDSNCYHNHADCTDVFHAFKVDEHESFSSCGSDRNCCGDGLEEIFQLTIKDVHRVIWLVQQSIILIDSAVLFAFLSNNAMLVAEEANPVCSLSINCNITNLMLHKCTKICCGQRMLNDCHDLTYSILSVTSYQQSRRTIPWEEHHGINYPLCQALFVLLRLVIHSNVSILIWGCLQSDCLRCA
jgi:hypothetical protein